LPKNSSKPCAGKILIQVAEVILAELPRRVAEWLEQLGDRRILCLEANR